MPVEVAYKNFVDTLSTLINHSGLPAFVIGPALRNALFQIDQIAEANYQKALADYQGKKSDDLPSGFGEGEPAVETHTIPAAESDGDNEEEDVDG